MFHHYLLDLNEEETLRKVYEKTKTKNHKKVIGFNFLQTMDEEKILNMSKVDYKKLVKKSVKKAAFKCLIEEKMGTQRSKI